MPPDRAPAESPRAPWWARLHGALMPDYNRRATAFWWLMVLGGALVLAMALNDLRHLDAGSLTVVIGGAVLATLAGLFPLRVPRWKNSFTAGEIFAFLLLLLHGPAAGALAASAEGFVAAWRTSTRWTSRLASPAMGCLAMYATGSALDAMLQTVGGRAAIAPAWLLVVLIGSAMLYFLSGMLLSTAIPYLKRAVWPSLDDLFGHFGWVGITSAASASIAGLLFLTSRQAGLGVLLAAAPIIALLLLVLHYHFRQREAEEAVRAGQLEAAEREARQAEAHVIELKASEERFHSAFSHASIGMALVGFDGRILQANAALCTLLAGGDEAALVSRPLGGIVDAQDRSALLAQVDALVQHRSASFACECRVRDEGGDTLWVAVHGSRFAEGGGTAPCLILQLQDVSARRRAEAGLQHIAFHDSLTGLPNRLRFQQLLTEALDRTLSGQGMPFALMFLDFDRFKLINDSLGHAVGDEFLVAVARRIQHQLRPDDVVARLGGDEFAILAADLHSERYAVGLAERLLEALRHPLHVAGNDISTSVSIGITLGTEGYRAPSDMLRDADTAMYKAKAAGKARYALFDAALHTEVAHRMRMEGDLRRALNEGKIKVAYQPLHALDDRRVLGVEALVRWDHPELGALEPEAFVPIAEEAGMAVLLTDHVLGTACRQLAAWRRSTPAAADLRVHINLSGVDIAHPNLCGRVQAALADAGLQPSHLALELTENELMRRLDGALPALTQLRRSGVDLYLDDFGTGYSSLRHLAKLPLTGLKLDRTFVADDERGASEESIVRALVMIGRSLDKTIVAEGIETSAQLERARQAGCRSGQGYLLSRPMSARDVERLLMAKACMPASIVGAFDDVAQQRLH